ncbi:SurA N-terminal domain-containing protein [Desulfobotulus sp. H1]|uniref:Periplasmic chaperone PpiD n=1 Tax=Desulfobotulus pelophilus TaxID=2823377 RepID=A0ABT3N8D0_9BACT|nr:peptidylprolyl isomerase [Desulfobotulus pelophilus]MCW7753708.1 SurA N-terminal domain-containing protein [Desulfobotulus pelophilus]
MLARIRAKASSWMVKFILGIIVLVFVFLGVESYHMGQQSKVVTVNGTVIDIEVYRAEYQSLVDQIRRQFGGNVSHEILELFRVEEQALQRLIERELLLQEAARQNLQVTDGEVAASIASIPAFQSKGAFDPALYRSLLERSGMGVAFFEARQREDLLLGKLQNLIFGGIHVSEMEVRDFFNARHRKIAMEAAVFRPADFTPEPVTEEVLLARYETHKEVYRTEPMRKAVFLRFAMDDFIDRIEVQEEEVHHEYEVRLESFRDPEKITARHILIQVDEDAEAERLSAAREDIERIRKEILSGADFSEMARQYSHCPSASEGGSLGTFPKEAMVAPFSAAAFALKEGEISEPVQTRFGWHLILVDEKRKESIKPLEEVAAGIRRELREEKARHKVYDAADAAYDATLSGADLREVSGIWELPLHTTSFFGRRGPSSGVTDGRAFAEAAFSLSDSEVSELVEIDDALYLISVTERVESRIPSFEETKDRLEADIRKEMASDMARAKAEEVLTLIQKGEAGASPLTVTGLFGKNDPIPQIGRLPALNRAVFSLENDKTMPDEPVNLEEGFAVFRILERVLPDEGFFMAARKEMEAELRGQKQNRMYGQWINGLKSGAKIKVEPAFQRQG